MATQRIIHVTSVASSAAQEIERLGLASVRELFRLISETVGPSYRITGPDKIITTRVDEARGGRSDDAARAADIQSALANDNVAAIVCIRGGAWFVRCLPLIDFDVLKRRKKPLFIFGFSEMTPLVGIAGAYPQCCGLYDLCPGFLFAGPARWAEQNIKELTRGMDVPKGGEKAFALGWAAGQYRTRFLGFFREVVDILEGRGTPRRPEGWVMAGKLPGRSKIRIVGGNMDLTRSLLASPYAPAFDARGKWLAIEDLNESPDRLDRMMSAIHLAGLLDHAEGVLLGDFHSDELDHTPAMFEILKKHLTARKNMPVVRLTNFGHIWPIAPLPMHREVTLVVDKTPRTSPKAYIEIPWHTWG